MFGLLNDDDQDEPSMGLLGGGDSARMQKAMMFAGLSSAIRGGDPMKTLMAIHQMQQQQAQGAKQQQFQQKMAGIFTDPSQAQPGEQVMGSIEEPLQQGLAADPAGRDPRLIRAEQYQRAAASMAQMGNDKAAKRYADIAHQLAPQVQEEWSNPVQEMVDGRPAQVQYSKAGGRRVISGGAPVSKFSPTPQTVMGPNGPMLVVLDDQGNMRPLEGAAPKPELTAPFETAGGLATMDQLSGQVRGLGVQPGLPTSVKEFQFAQGNPAFDAREMALKKAGSTNVSLSPQIRVGNTLGENIAQEVAKRAMNDIGQGDSALSTLQQVDTIRQNVDQAITGPMNEPRTAIARLKSMVGIGGDATKDQLAATARTAQALAETELKAAEAMKGQGQITEAERAIIAKAAAGKLANDPAEIKAATEALEKVARARIRQAQRGVSAIKANPDFQPLFPFVDGKLADAPPGGPPIAPIRPAAPGRKPPAGKTVVRTGKLNGRRVIQYSDGSTAYAD